MKDKYPVERGCWLYYAPLHNCFYVIYARRVVKVHDDGTATYTFIGRRRQVDADSVLNSARDHAEWGQR